MCRYLQHLHWDGVRGGGGGNESRVGGGGDIFALNLPGCVSMKVMEIGLFLAQSE